MVRFYVQAYLDSFFTQKSGDIAGEGEFYFKCNKKRFPDKGVIKLGKGETFDPEPNPTLYTAMMDAKDKEVKFDISVWEEDPGFDDKFLEKKFKLPLRPMKETFELRDKKGKCSLKLIVSIKEAQNW